MTRFSVQIGESAKPSIVSFMQTLPDDRWVAVEVDGKTLELRWQRSTHTFFVKALGSSCERVIRMRSWQRENSDGDTTIAAELFATAAGQPPVPVALHATVGHYLPGLDLRSAAGQQKKNHTVRSQITGKVIKVLVAPGANVAKGDTLFVIEAMKMENRVFAPASGVMESVKAAEGVSVSSGDELAKIGPAQP